MWNSSLHENRHGFRYLFSPKYIVFMLAGVAFALHYRGVYRTRELVLSVVAICFVFSVCSNYELRLNYLIAVVVFMTMYAWRSRIKSNRFLEFFSAISYPLYVSHAALGYVGIRAMIEYGVVPELALFAQVIISISLASLIHKFIENPTHIMGKSATNKCINIFNKNKATL